MAAALLEMIVFIQEVVTRRLLRQHAARRAVRQYRRPHLTSDLVLRAAGCHGDEAAVQPGWAGASSRGSQR